MACFNMDHGDVDYEHRFGPTDSTRSSTFGDPVDDRVFTDALLWLGRQRGAAGVERQETSEDERGAVARW